MIRATRWSDNDRNFGPFTFSWTGKKGYRTFAVILKSWGSGDDDEGPASLRISLIWFTFIIFLPPILRPKRRKVYPGPKNWGPDVMARLGRDWYWDVKVREYGFSYSYGFLQVHYGICPGDSSQDQTWCKHLPWTQWRHIRRSLYDLDGRHFWSEIESETDNYRRANRLGRSDLWRSHYEIVQNWENMCPKAVFAFKDHDGEELTATTCIEEREWRFGTGWFKWLSLFRRPRICRYLDLRFSGETGPEKGSYKGGTIGTSIEMLSGELHEAAFRRYCTQEHRSKYRPYTVTFVEKAASNG